MERITEDMELEFSGLFPKHSDLRIVAVQVLLRLEQEGSLRQSLLAEELDVEPSAMSRLLNKLEAAKHITRSREGTDKIVSLWTNETG